MADTNSNSDDPPSNINSTGVKSKDSADNAALPKSMPDTSLTPPGPPDDTKVGNVSKGVTEGSAVPATTPDADPTTTRAKESEEPPDAERILRLQVGLLDAAASDAPEKVMDLVSQLKDISPDVDICPRDSEENTPLHHLAVNLDAETQTIIDFLSLLNEDQINALNVTNYWMVFGNKNTALHLAASFNATDTVRALLDAGADPTIQNDQLRTALHVACQGFHTQPARVICQYAIQHDISLDVPDNKGYTALHMACEDNFPEIVELLLSPTANVDPERRTKEGETPLLLAASTRNEDAVRLLLKRRVDLEAGGGRYEATALITASMEECAPIVNMLLDAKAVVDRFDRCRRTALSWAVLTNRSTTIAQMLLKAGADVNTQDRRGYTTPLHFAAIFGKPAMMLLLLEHDADINKANRYGCSALYLACLHSQPEAVEILLENHADPLVQARYRKTPLHAAIIGHHGDASVVEMLLASDRGRSLLNLADSKEGYAPLHWVSSVDQSRDEPASAPLELRKMMRILLRHGADTSARTVLGMTVLHVAAIYGRRERVHILLDHMKPEDITATTNNGRTALDIAAEGRCRHTASILLQRSSCGLGVNPIDDAMISWACEDESTHDIVRMKLLRDVGTPAPIQPEWGALDVAAHLGDYIVVQKLLRGLSRTERGLGKIQHAIGVIDAAQKRTGDLDCALTDQNFPDRSQVVDKNPKVIRRPEQQEETAQKRQTKDPSRNPYFRYQAVRTLLRVAENSARTSTIAEDLRPPEGGVDADFTSPAAIFDFYASGGGTSTVTRHVAPVRSVIYDHGPTRIMRERQEGEENARTMVEFLEWPNDDHSQELKKEALLELNPARDHELRIRWIHLPANNMKWMEVNQDLMTRILYDRAGPRTVESRAEETDGSWSYSGDSRSSDDSDSSDEESIDFPESSIRERDDEAVIEPPRHDPKLPGLRSFFDRSWIEFPDSSSISRVMKARCVKKRITTTEKVQPRPARRGADWVPRSPGAVPTDQGKCGGVPTPPTYKSFEPLALYMPYLTFAKQDASMAANSMKPFTDNSHIVHGSRTLDEFYYQFTSDREYEQADIDKRNRNQVVTRWLHRGEDIVKLESWIVLRVDQLWLWIVAPDVIITSSTHRLDGRPDVVSSMVFSHLQKGHSQPKTAYELADLITTICIRFYDQVHEAAPKISTKDGKGEQDASTEAKPEAARESGGLTIQEIFSNSINKVAIEEVELFETFTKDEEVTTDDANRPLATKKVTVVKPARLLCEVKDLQDEINILRAIVAQQQRVQDAFLDEEPSEGSITGQIIARIDDMDKYAARIYSAVHATLGLEQNKIAIGYSNEAVRQGRNLMAFTATTILFLPLSFLASLFALDVTSFPHKENGDVSFSPQWIFPLIFLISAAFWVLVIVYAFYDRMAGLFELQLVQNMRRWGRNITRQRPKKQNHETQSEEVETKSHSIENEIRLKPRGLRRIGLTWRRRRGIYTEEDALSAIELNDVPRRPELGKKQVITP